MKGFAMLGLNKTGWIEKPKPECGPLDAILRPVALAPCTSDVHTVWEGGIGDLRDRILGHEAVGEVVEVGSLVKDFKKGDVCIVPAITPDWNALESQAGFHVHAGGMLGGYKFTNLKDGVFAELFHVNDADGNLAKLPPGMDPETACMLTDMVPTGFHGSELAEVEYGDTVLVIGIGPVGLMAVRGAVLHGAGRLFAVGSRQKCIDLAKEYGATDIINYKNGTIRDQLMKLTNNEGVDKIITAGGDIHTMEEAIRMLKPGGTIANINYLGSGDYLRIPRAEWGAGMGHKRITGGLMPGGRLRIEKLAQMVVLGRVDPSKLITHRFKGLEKIEEALLLMKDKTSEVIKPVVSIKY
ncbi:putative NADP-dependent isopropanol dehydrogenase [Campylobacterota bacterium]|nr:putative NADP-dependent isopropanol dehydrogenase [Campylobacterota bacterium]